MNTLMSGLWYRKIGMRSKRYKRDKRYKRLSLTSRRYRQSTLFTSSYRLWSTLWNQTTTLGYPVVVRSVVSEGKGEEYCSRYSVVWLPHTMNPWKKKPIFVFSQHYDWEPDLLKLLERLSSKSSSQKMLGFSDLDSPVAYVTQNSETLSTMDARIRRKQRNRDHLNSYLIDLRCWKWCAGR